MKHYFRRLAHNVIDTGIKVAFSVIVGIIAFLISYGSNVSGVDFDESWS